MSAPQIERRGAPGGLRAAGRTLTGYAAVFSQEAPIGAFSERIQPGAFAASLASGRDVLALLDHKPDTLLGRTRSGTLRLHEDDRGLAFELDVPDTSAGHDLIVLAERGDLGGMSFGFIATDEKWTGDTRELRSIELHEISVVQSWPAYSQTEISLRSKKPTLFFLDGPRLWMETCR